jgi:hypothetical protein
MWLGLNEDLVGFIVHWMTESFHAPLLPVTFETQCLSTFTTFSLPLTCLISLPPSLSLSYLQLCLLPLLISFSPSALSLGFHIMASFRICIKLNAVLGILSL